MAFFKYASRNVLKILHSQYRGKAHVHCQLNSHTIIVMILPTKSNNIIPFKWNELCYINN